MARGQQSGRGDNGVFSEDEQREYQNMEMQREEIIENLRGMGCRITKQRRLLLDIILSGKYACCKEIYFLAAKKEPNIGMATIYRMVNILEEIGALQGRQSFQICCHNYGASVACKVSLDDESCIILEEDKLSDVIEQGLKTSGRLKNRRVVNVSCWENSSTEK